MEENTQDWLPEFDDRPLVQRRVPILTWIQDIFERRLYNRIASHYFPHLGTFINNLRLWVAMQEFMDVVALGRSDTVGLRDSTTMGIEGLRDLCLHVKLELDTITLGEVTEGDKSVGIEPCLIYDDGDQLIRTLQLATRILKTMLVPKK